MSNKILALDLSKSLGYALLEGDKIVKTGSYLLSYKTDVHPGAKFIRLVEFLNQYSDVDEILYEFVPRFVSAQWAVNYGGYLGQLMMFCNVNGIRFGSLKPTQIKQVFTGKGNADKKAICAVCHKIGWRNGKPGTDIDNDEADAIALLVATMMNRGREISFSD